MQTPELTVVIGPLRCGKVVTVATGKTQGTAELVTGPGRRRTGITSPMEVDVKLETRCVLPHGHLGVCVDRYGAQSFGLTGTGGRGPSCAGCGCQQECNCLSWFHPHGLPAGGFNFSPADLHSAAKEVGVTIEPGSDGTLFAFDPSRVLIAVGGSRQWGPEPLTEEQKRQSAAGDLFRLLLEVWPPFAVVAERFETWGIQTGRYAQDRCPGISPDRLDCPKPLDDNGWQTCDRCRRAQVLLVPPRPNASGEVKGTDARLRWVYRAIGEARP